MFRAFWLVLEQSGFTVLPTGIILNIVNDQRARSAKYVQSREMPPARYYMPYNKILINLERSAFTRISDFRQDALPSCTRQGLSFVFRLFVRVLDVIFLKLRSM